MAHPDSSSTGWCSGGHAADRCATYAVLFGALAAAVLCALLMRLLCMPWRTRSGGRRLATTKEAWAHPPPDADGALAPVVAAEARRRSSLADPNLRLSWDRLSYRVSRSHTLLQPSSGAIGPGLWIMIGPSGAGKSTLLGVLAGRKARGVVSGDVRLGGRVAPGATRRALLGYVTQAGILPGTSTVREHLHFHARLRLPWLTADERGALVARALAALQLAPLADRLIGDHYLRGLLAVRSAASASRRSCCR